MFENNLIIGLGGQGGRSIAAFRREMVKNPFDAANIQEGPNYSGGGNRKRVSYLYIDSSDDQLREKPQWEQYGKSVILPPADVIQLTITKSVGELSKLENISPWIGDLDKAMTRRKGRGAEGAGVRIKGAGQLRRYGRALFASHASKIEKELMSRIGKLTMGGAGLCCHVFCTLGGGTGSGGLIDLLTMLNTIVEDITTGEVKIFVYCYLAGPALRVQNTGYFFENEYAALRDLNALVCDKFHPYMTGLVNAEGHTRYSASGLVAPVSQVFISSEYTTGTDISIQIENMARSCFNFIASEGSLHPNIQKSFSGEDLLESNPGEDGRLSYCFSGVSTKSWFLPTSQIKELLKMLHEARVADAWLKGNGKYAKKPALRASSDVERDVLKSSYHEKLENIIEGHRKTLNKLRDAEIKNGSRDADALGKFAEKGMKLYESLLTEAISGAELLKLEEARGDEVERIASKVCDYVSTQVQWRGVGVAEVWGLQDALTYVESYIGAIQTQSLMNEMDEDEADLEQVKDNMEARVNEWKKLGLLSCALLSLDEKMIEQHADDVWYYVSRPLVRAKQGSLKLFYDDLVTSLQVIQTALQTAITGVEGLRDHAADSAAVLRSSLSNRADTAFECHEADAAHLKTVLDALEKEDLSTYLGQYNASWKEHFAPLTDVDSDSAERLSLELCESFYSDSVRLHDAMVGRRRLRSLLAASILEYLSRIAGPKQDQWDTRLRPRIEEFLGSLPMSAALEKAGVYLRNPQEAWQGAVAIGLPKDPRYDTLVEWMKNCFEQYWSTNFPVRPGGFGIYRHESPEVIRLTYLPYWFPARFVKVVPRLYNFYAQAMRSLGADVKKYFCTLEDTPEVEQMPELIEDMSPQGNMVAGTVRQDVQLGEYLVVKNKQGYNVPAIVCENGLIRMIDPDTQDYGKAYTDKELVHPSPDFEGDLKKCLNAAIEGMDEGERTRIHEEYYARKLKDLLDESHTVNSDEYLEAEELSVLIKEKLGLP